MRKMDLHGTKIRFECRIQDISELVATFEITSKTHIRNITQCQCTNFLSEPVLVLQANLW